MIELPAEAAVGADRRKRLGEVLKALHNTSGVAIAGMIKDQLAVDLTTRYGNVTIAHPFGKASGQLSCTASQVGEDADSGLAFVVLKTVIGESAAGTRTMGEWASPETKMRVERRNAVTGRAGWTVTWKGRGWPGSLQEYCAFFEEALQRASDVNLLVVPSVKYHLPTDGQPHNADEYRFTTRALERVWSNYHSTPLILEKDLSPTLAGDARANERDTVLHWLTNLSSWIKESGDVRLGIKVMNAVYDDEFQLDMLRAMNTAAVKPDFLVVFNRLFDRAAGIAYGGWDLSDRNLRVLENARANDIPLPTLSATGNICSGRMMVEYALRGCASGQVHTFFQVPRTEYVDGVGSRSRRALMTLLLDPKHGLVPWLWTLNELGHLDPQPDGLIHFQDIVGLGFR